jgi:hypothetical protein
MRGLLLAALTEAALISWRDLSNDKVLPMPSDYASVALFYGGLGLLPSQAEGFASLVGWGIVVATFLGLWDPTAPTRLALPGGKQVSGGKPPVGSNVAPLSPGAPLSGTGPTISTPNPTGGAYPVKAR